MNDILLAIIIAIVIIVIARYFGLFSYDRVNVAGFDYHVLNNYGSSSAEAAQRLAEVYSRVLKFLEYEKIKYRVGLTREEEVTLGAGALSYVGGGDGGKRYSTTEIIDHIIFFFNPEKVYENDPNNISGSTSYTIQKGREMYVCLRQKDGSFVDMNTMMFVVIHEIAHIGAFWTFGHPPDFWAVFGLLLRDAIECGVYDYVDYRVHPQRYCSIMITSSPYNPGETINLIDDVRE
jgi:hypothetical protein